MSRSALALPLGAALLAAALLVAIRACSRKRRCSLRFASFNLEIREAGEA